MIGEDKQLPQITSLDHFCLAPRDPLYLPDLEFLVSYPQHKVLDSQSWLLSRYCKAHFVEIAKYEVERSISYRTHWKSAI